MHANFKAWDLNGDGALDRREIELAAQDPAFNIVFPGRTAVNVPTPTEAMAGSAGQMALEVLI